MELPIEQALQQGVAAHKEGKVQDAEKLYRAILQSQPLHPDANHNLGVLAVSVNKADLALPLFKTALEANPKIEQFWLSYIDALIKEKQFENAKQVFEQAKTQGMAGDKLNVLETQLTPTAQVNEPKLAVQNKSLSYSQKRKKPSKKKNIKKKAKKQNLKANNPSQQQLNSLLEHYQNGRFSDAEKLAMHITQAFPKHQFAWKVLGAVLGATGRNSEALNANQSEVALYPQDAAAHNNLGVTLKELGRLDEALASCRQAIELKPDLVEAHYNLGNALKELGRLDEALASYTQAIVLKPDLAEAHYNLGNTLTELGRSDQAIANYAQAIELKPDYVEAHSNLGNSLNELERLDEALACYTQVIELKPDYADAHYNLGNGFKELGRLDEALACYTQAIALKPDYVEAHTNIGNTLHDLGRYDEALASYTQAIALKPDYAGAHYNLGMLLFESKKYNLAAEQFELCDTHESKLYGIKCSYFHDKESVFYEKFDFLVNQGVVNAALGSLGLQSKAKYGIKKSNPFCNDPLKHVLKTNLNELYDFEKIFIDTAKDVLTDKSVSYKEQGHLTNGVQTSGNIFTQGKVPKTDIKSIIYTEIEKYRFQFKDSKEGFIKNWPTSYEIKGWLICMQRGGKLAPHIHDTGWITGSIYINVPPKSETDSGNLVLCLSDQYHVLGVEKSQQSIIDVVTGSLCLFPSSLHHYTVPFEEKEERIVLAFDVIPK